MFSNFTHTILWSCLLFSLMVAETATSNEEVDVREGTAEVLATVHLSNGNTVRFMRVPSVKGILVEELVAVDSTSDFVFDQLKGSLLDRYMAITPQFAPVPESLLRVNEELEFISQLEDQKDPDQASDGMVASKVTSKVSTEGKINSFNDSDRQVLAMKGAEFYVDVDALDNVSGYSQQRAASNSCNVNTGAAHFEQTHCNTNSSIGWYFNPAFWVESYCFNDQHTWLQKTSWANRRVAYVRTANCGGSPYGHPSRVYFLSKRSQWFHFDTSVTVPWNSIGSYHWYTVEDYRKRVQVQNADYPGEFSRTWIRYYTFRQSAE